VKIGRRSPNIGKPFVKTSRINLYSSQIKKLEKIAQREGKARVQVVREAVKRFLGKRTFERNTFNFNAPSAKGTKGIYPRFSKSDWDMLNKISKNTGRCKTELLRKAVKEYLRE